MSRLTFGSNIVRRTVLRLLATATVMLALGLAAPQESAARSGGGTFEMMQVPASDGSGRNLLVNVMRPSGSGPFPLVVINHGSPAASRRSVMKMPTFFRLTHWLVAQGYVVALPLRRGYGAVGGRWDESYGSCRHPDFRRAGLETARDIQTVIDAMVRKDFVRKRDVVVIGKSAGGWGTLALASLNPPDVIGYVNFSGGRGAHRGGVPNRNCAPGELVRAAAEFGKGDSRPTLWIYAENDSYFGPPLVRQMYQSYRAAGGKAELHMLAPVSGDGHRAISDEQAFAQWSPLVGRFLHGLK